MSNFFLWFGVTCAGIVSLALLIMAHSIWLDIEYKRYYSGILDQISDTIDRLGDAYGERLDAKISVHDAMTILRYLHNRRFPAIENMKYTNDIAELEAKEEADAIRDVARGG